MIGNDDPFRKIILNNKEIASSNEGKLGILLEVNYVSLQKTCQRLSVLTITKYYLNQGQKILLLNLVVKSQFCYSPLMYT